MKKRNVNLTTDAHREAFNGFADALHSIEGREGRWSTNRISDTINAALERTDDDHEKG